MAHFNWTPGIGDPTIGGWITVVLYLLASVSSWKTARSLSLDQQRPAQERHAWQSISAAFLALGINKQLDLQSALTEFGRMLALSEGWYDHRRDVQLVFILFVALLCFAAAAILAILVHNAPPISRLALIGTTFVFGFVLIRAASFHHIDRFIGTRILNLRWNWILEMGGISVVLFASEWRRKKATAYGQKRT